MNKLLEIQRNDYFLAFLQLGIKLKIYETLMTKILDTQRNYYFLASLRLSSKL